MYSMAVVLLMVVLMLGYLWVSRNEEFSFESESPYECGFEPMYLTRTHFSHRFFLISVLFLIFDVEVVLMLPLPYLVVNVVGGVEFFAFVLILVMGLMYEYYFGSLDWLW